MKPSDELLAKVKKGIQATGYPLELEIGAMLRGLGWIPFHSVEYLDPETEKPRELDLLVYKLVKKRRLELRVSAKTSVNKQFVFFTRKRTSFPSISDLKHTPVAERTSHSIPTPIAKLPIFAHDRDTVNFTVMSGENIDREARALLKDAMMSSINSIHHRILPNELLVDERGTLYFFLVILRANMFEARFDDETNQMVVTPCEYARWHGRINMPKKYQGLTIPSASGLPVKLSDVLYWFGDWITVEFLSDSSFPHYLGELEGNIEALEDEDLALFGKDWTPENFPKLVAGPPSISSTNPPRRL